MVAFLRILPAIVGIMVEDLQCRTAGSTEAKRGQAVVESILAFAVVPFIQYPKYIVIRPTIELFEVLVVVLRLVCPVHHHTRLLKMAVYVHLHPGFDDVGLAVDGQIGCLRDGRAPPGDCPKLGSTSFRVRYFLVA